MKRNVLWIAALATTMMTSCIYDNENDPTVVQQQGQYSNDEVKIMASMGGTASTRATYNLQSDNLDDWTKAGIFVYRTTKTGPDNTAPSYVGYSNVKITSPATAATAPSSSSPLELTPSKPLYFPSNNTNVDVYVYAPYASAYDYNSSTNPNPVTAMAFTVKEDQSTDANYIASDFVYGKGMADYNDDKTAKVTMYHALTKLTFKIEDVGGIAGNIEEIDLLDVYKKATIDMSKDPNGTAPWLTGTHVSTSTNAGDKGDVKVADATTTTDLYTKLVKPATGIWEGVSAIIPAQSGMSDSAGPKVKVKIGSNEKENYLGSASLNAFQPGYEYVYTLKIKSEEVIVTVVSIKPWVPGDAQERDLKF